ncbi:hypothetical protein HK098_001258 [Nowakowskiella sp. JEL0407]|nr:hypothetical protein HK098_001258 [Nowakowskiella sp. JEL0407]
MYINNDTIYISGTFHGDDGSSGIFSRQYNAGATLQVEDKLDNSVLNRNLTVGNPGAVLSITPNEYVNCGGYLYFTTYSQVNQTLRISLYNTGDPKGGIQKSNSNVIPKDDIVVWQTCTNSTTIGSKIDSKLLILVHNASSDDSSQYIITVDNNLVISQPKSIQASKETIKIDSTDQSVNFRFGILEPLKDNLNFLSIEYAQVDQIPPTSRNAMVGPYSLKIYSKTLIDWNTSSDLPKNSSNDPTISDCPSHYFLNRTTGACMKCLPTTPSIECAVSGSLWDPWVWGNLNVQQIIFISSVSGVVFVAMVISAWIFLTKRKKKLNQKNVSRPQNSVVFNIPNSNTTAPTFKDIVNPQTETVDLNNGINLQAPKPSSKRMIIQSSSIPQRLSADMSKLLQRLSRISNSSIEELEVKKDVNILNSGKNPFEVEGKANVQDETIATTDAATALRPISLINPKHHPLPDKTAEDDRASISSSSTGSSDSDGPVLSKSAQARLSNRLQPHIRAARESAEASNKYQRPSHHSSKPLTSNSSKSNLHRTSERDSTRIRHPDSLRYSTNRLSTTHYPSHRASQYHVPGGYGAVVRQSFHPQDPRLFHTYQQVNPYAPASIVTAAQPMYYPQPQVHIVHQRPPYGAPTTHSHHNRAKGKKESSHETRKRRVKVEKEDSGKTDKLVES